MNTFVRKVLQAETWAHHHTAMVLTGVFLSGFMAFWQLFVPQLQTHAASLDCATASHIMIPVSECQALLDIYTDTNGPSWNSNSNWYTDTNVCLWYGVGCTTADGSGFAHVKTLDIDTNNLNGSIPSTIADLPFLTLIDIYQNPNLTLDLSLVQSLTGLTMLSASNTIVQ